MNQSNIITLAGPKTAPASVEPVANPVDNLVRLSDELNEKWQEVRTDAELLTDDRCDDRTQARASYERNKLTLLLTWSDALAALALLDASINGIAKEEAQ